MRLMLAALTWSRERPRGTVVTQFVTRGLKDRTRIPNSGA